MRVSDLTRPKPTAATIDLGDGDIIQLTFDRNKVTPAWASEAEARAEAQDATALSKALAEVIIEWDVTNDDGSPFPATPENLSVLSYPAQQELLRQLLAAAVPSRAEGNASSGQPNTPSSASTEPQQTSPNGQATSPSPAPLASPSPT